MINYARPFAIGALTSAMAATLLAQPPQRTTAPPANRFVVIGCISREAQPAAGGGRGAASARYTIADNRGEKPTVYRLEGDAAQLELHVGHTVEVAGPLSAAPAGGRGPNANALVLKVTTLTWISTKCAK